MPDTKSNPSAIHAEYTDVFIKKPAVLLKISPEQQQVMKDHSIIMNYLQDQENSTVKEIHSFFFDPAIKKYSKSLKTIYRYMEILENAGLVQVSGYRKPNSSNITEKLYSRTAVLFVLRESLDDTPWWKTPSGQNIFQIYIQYISKILEIPKDNLPKLDKLVKNFLSDENSQISTQFDKIESNNDLTELLLDIPGFHLKELFRLTHMLSFFSKKTKNSEFLQDLL